MKLLTRTMRSSSQLPVLLTLVILFSFARQAPNQGAAQGSAGKRAYKAIVLERADRFLNQSSARLDNGDAALSTISRTPPHANRQAGAAMTGRLPPSERVSNVGNASIHRSILTVRIPTTRVQKHPSRSATGSFAPSRPTRPDGCAGRPSPLRRASRKTSRRRSARRVRSASACP